MLRRCSADLHHAVVLAGGGQHGLAFDNIDADRLLDEDVDARFRRLNHGERMPVIRRPNQDDVQILFGQHLAVIGIGARSLLRFLARSRHLRGIRQHLAVHVAERNNLDRRHLHQSKQVALAIPAAADQPHTPPLIVVVFLSLAEGSAGQAESTGLKEFASVHRPYKDI